MKLVSAVKNGREFAGLVSNDRVFDLQQIDPSFPASMREFLANWDEFYAPLRDISETAAFEQPGFQLAEVHLLAPLPDPISLRDGYAFRQHVATARKNRGLDMTAVFDSFPVFYFGNHRTVFGPGAVHCMPDHFRKLDFELEAAVVICREGKNIAAGEADEYIGGLMILNDFSARTFQLEEMALNLGPAKGKDFATTTGPWLVTLDELQSRETECRKNHIGKSWDLNMSAVVNGLTVSKGNLSDMEWTFAELIERASYGVDLYPGDIIGSGTVGTGCFLELNGTGKRDDPDYAEQWLKDGDQIELTIDGLGTLINQIRADNTNYSILELKK